MKNKKNCIIVTGGGTAGHIMPIIALLDSLKENFNQIVYVGSKNGMEKDIIKNYSFVKFFAIDTVKFDRTSLLRNFKIPFLLLKGIFQSRKIIKECKPTCIFSKGGYVSLPVCLASNVPIIAHESDLTLGLANKIIYKKCKVLCTNFYETSKTLKKAVYTGLPMKTNNGCEKLEFLIKDGLPNLLILGGSLGSRIINQIIFENIFQICSKFNVIHIVGAKNKINAKFPENYNQVEFVQNMHQIYSTTNFAISRAGANTICELKSYNIPMLLIPLSKKVSRGDQEMNAKNFEEQGLALTLKEENLNKENLFTKLNLLSQMQKKKFKGLINSGTNNVMKQILKHSL